MFKELSASPSNPKWKQLIKRESHLYKRERDPRNEFNRDYNRILHSQAFRRLKHKTQVFFAPDNDHICTRIEHVNHVVSISRTIARALELNLDLTDAIAIGHDLGHAPFGHEGEKILAELTEKYLGQSFWHERNSLWFADNVETLANEENKQENLLLTYGVRDGLICHCGEIDEDAIKPREEPIDLYTLEKPSQVQPFSWEGCVVKIADKIAFYGRDAEDAITLGLISTNDFYSAIYKELHEFNEQQKIRNKLHSESKEINNTTLIHSFILDLLENSDPENGMRFSPWYLHFLKALRKVSNSLIYDHVRLDHSKKRVRLVIESIFDELTRLEYKNLTSEKIKEGLSDYHMLRDAFLEWIIKYTSTNEELKENYGFSNKTIYDVHKKKQYIKSIIDFISGMTDNFALNVFEELTRFS